MGLKATNLLKSQGKGYCVANDLKNKFIVVTKNSVMPGMYAENTLLIVMCLGTIPVSPMW